MDAVALPKQDMVEFGNCRKCQKCTDFTQIHPFLALLRTRLSTPCKQVLDGLWVFSRVIRVGKAQCLTTGVKTQTRNSQIVTKSFRQI